MTPKQHEYVRHRLAGLNQTGAAVAAGYARGSAKALASRMEKLPEIREAIDKARETGKAGATGTIEFEDAQSYLSAVVRGETPPDPVRVGAARSLLPYQQPRRRAPVKSATPRQMNEREALTNEQDLLDAWARKAEAVRQRLRDERARKL